MEKSADIKPEHTPDTEHRLGNREKQAQATGGSVLQDQVRRLDDDVTHRLADAAAATKPN